MAHILRHWNAGDEFASAPFIDPAGAEPSPCLGFDILDESWSPDRSYAVPPWLGPFPAAFNHREPHFDPLISLTMISLSQRSYRTGNDKAWQRLRPC